MLIEEKVEKCISDFSLLQNKGRVIVAYSGGKDSLFLCYILKKLGFDVQAYIIDIGYNADWSKAVQNINKIDKSIPCTVVDSKYIENSLPDIADEVKKYFKTVQMVYKKQGEIATTICTHCYNAKYLVLKALSEKVGINKIAFGHHGTDAVTSLLKSYFMFEDRWTSGHETFKLSNIYDLVENSIELFKDQQDFKNKILPRLNFLLQQQKISTNEAPLEIKNGVNIIRPFFYCREEEILKNIKSFKLSPVKSECSYLYRKNLVETSREYIQYHLTNKHVTDRSFDSIIDLIKNSLNKDGSLKFDARKNRDLVLGSSYKNDGICSEKL